jgi:undecaprenyl diphosphate synthase
MARQDEMSDSEAAPKLSDGFGAPGHVAIIMDGNGRWAAQRGLPRVEGHRRGVEALRRTVRAAGDLGIDYLTIFSFSSENWSRPPTEVRELMGLLRRFVRNDLADLHKSNVRVRIIGEREDLDPEISRLLQEAEDLTRHNTGLVLVVAFNYAARRSRAPRGARPRKSRPAGSSPRRSPPRCSPAISTRPTCRTPISSSAPAASSDSRTS